jgi:hypothetical protein
MFQWGRLSTDADIINQKCSISSDVKDVPWGDPFFLALILFHSFVI